MSPFPALTTILDPAALAHEVLPGFGLGEIRECHFYSGGFNHTYRVAAAAGVYYLRAYRRGWRTLADIRCELDALRHLEARGFPAARPQRYRDGQDFCAVAAPEGTRYLALFSEAPGSAISYEAEPAEMAARYGRAVAAMHNALDGFSSPHARFGKDLDHFTLQPLATIEPFLSHRPVDWATVQQFAATLRARILGLPARQLTHGFCHGDLQGYHANVAPDGTLTFYDFDCGGFGFLAYDLAVFLWCCRLEEAVESRWAPFLDGYRAVRPIPTPDLEAVGLFVCARYLWHMGVHTRNAPDWGHAFLDDGYFDTHLARLRRAADDYLA